MRRCINFSLLFGVFLVTRSFANEPLLWQREEIKQGDQRTDVLRLLRFHQCQEQRLDYSMQSLGGAVVTSPSDSFYLPREHRWLVLHFDRHGRISAIDIAKKIEEKPRGLKKDQFDIDRVMSYRFKHEVQMATVAVGDETKAAIKTLEQDWRRKSTAGAKGPYSYLIDKRWLLLRTSESRITSILVDGTTNDEIKVPVLVKRTSGRKSETSLGSECAGKAKELVKRKAAGLKTNGRE